MTRSGKSSSLAGMSQHRPPRTDGEKLTKPGFNTAESPLAWLRARKGSDGRPLISDVQYMAGERLRADYERAMMTGRVTTSWDMSASSGRGGSNRVADISDGAIAARQRHHAAVAAIGPELAGIAVPVCCMSYGMEQAERALDLPKRSGRAVLGLALNALARHYGLGAVPDGRRKVGAWMEAGARPRIQPADDA